jgi:hypothetical protein
LWGEQAVTPEMALRLGKLCGNRPEFWMCLQMLRDLGRLERTLAAGLQHPEPTRRVSQRRAIRYRSCRYWFLTPFFPDTFFFLTFWLEVERAVMSWIGPAHVWRCGKSTVKTDSAAKLWRRGPRRARSLADGYCV